MFEGRRSAWMKLRALPLSHISLNEMLMKEIPKHAHFINMSDRICKSSSRCRNSDGVDIYSYDGSHLTPYGARYVGKILLLEDISF